MLGCRVWPRLYGGKQFLSLLHPEASTSLSWMWASIGILYVQDWLSCTCWDTETKAWNSVGLFIWQPGLIFLFPVSSTVDELLCLHIILYNMWKFILQVKLKRILFFPFCLKIGFAVSLNTAGGESRWECWFGTQQPVISFDFVCHYGVSFYCMMSSSNQPLSSS